MAYVFIDESGDLGFSRGSSHWFVFTIAVVKNKRQLERVINKVRKGLKKKYTHVGELHAYHADPITRKRVLQLLSSVDDLNVLSVILHKDAVYIDLQNQKNYLYSYVANILLGRLFSRKIIPDDEELVICIDKKDTKKNIREYFIQYLEDALETKRAGTVNIILSASHEEKALQAVDFISWAVFRKYERNDTLYYEIIKGKIIEEYRLFQ